MGRVDPVVCVLRVTCACALVGEGTFFFCLWWSGLYEVVVLLADDLVVFLFYLLLG